MGSFSPCCSDSKMKGLWMFVPENLLLGLCLLPIFLVCAFTLLLVRFRTSRKNFPPGPLAFPVLGHLHLLGRFPHRSFHKLSSFYGPLLGLRLGSIPAIVASTPDMAAQILQIHDLLFASRPQNAAAKYITFEYSSMSTAPVGPYWRLLRQIFARELFNKKRLNSIVKVVRAEEVALLVRSVLDDCKIEREVKVISKLSSAGSNIIARVAFGKKLTELIGTGGEDPSESFLHLLSEMFNLAGEFNVGDYIPYLQWMDLQGYVRRMKVVREKSRSILQDIVDERRRLRISENPGSRREDMLDVLLCVSEDPQHELQITDDNIKAVILDLLLGGTDTSSITTEWALTEMLRRPETMKKVQEELDSAVGNERCLQESDLVHMPYLQAVVKETMRLHPAGPLLIQHEATQPCRVAGYEIPAKTLAIVNVWAIGRDPTAWERPLEFWPERFLESNVDVDVQGRHFQLLPFGSGRRQCPGMAVGLVNVQMMLGSLLQGFDWWLPPKTEVDMSEKFGLALRKAKPLVAVASPRLPHRLYNLASYAKE